MGITAYREYFDFNQTGSDPMKIERINENQIRCTLSNFDLSVRNMNLGELAYGTEKARNLFREMIQRAANEVGFEAEDIPLMVEAIPMANESVMLIITKMEDPEELDTRFSKFSPEEDENDNGWGNLTAEVLEGADGLINILTQSGILKPEGEKAPAAPAATANGPQGKEESKNPAQFTRIYQFSSLDLVCEAARQTGAVFKGNSVLYKNPENGVFYLILKKENDSESSFNRVCNTLSEYGTRLKGDAAASGAYYAEHYDVIVKKDALKVLQNLYSDFPIDQYLNRASVKSCIPQIYTDAFYVQSLFPKCPLVFSTYRIFMAHCSIYVKMEKGLQPGKFS